MRLPEAITSEEELDIQIRKLKWFIHDGNEAEQILRKVERVLRWYERTNFKGRYKTNEILFHERARVILIKAMYDKSKSQREALRD